MAHRVPRDVASGTHKLVTEHPGWGATGKCCQRRKWGVGRWERWERRLPGRGVECGSPEETQELRHRGAGEPGL